MLKLIFFFFQLSAFATSLGNRYQFLNTDLLPQDVWTFGVSHSQTITDGKDSFSSLGKKSSNQNSLSKDLTYSNLADEINNPLERDLAKQAFAAYGKESNEVAGRVINDVSVRQKADAYVLGRGLSKKSNLFIIFPVVTIQTQFRSEFVPSESLKKFARQLKNEGQQVKAKEIFDKSENALRDRLDENGYRSSYPSEITSLANIYVNHRFQAVEARSVAIAADSFVVLPAGKKFDQNDFIPMRINEEQVSLKQALTAAWKPSHRVHLMHSGYYHKRFSFNKSQRIPVNDVSPLSNNIDPDTKIQYGDTWGTSAQINFLPSEFWTIYLGQSLEYKLQDNFQGNKFSSQSYNYLEKNSDQRQGLGYLGFSVNTISHFLAQKFPLPMDLNLQYAKTNLGKNIFRNETIALNMMVFYK